MVLILFYIFFSYLFMFGFIARVAKSDGVILSEDKKSLFGAFLYSFYGIIYMPIYIGGLVFDLLSKKD